MSAPVLSPAELEEAKRFGIHDVDILAEMEEHADDVVPCFFVARCGEGAAWRIITRCCGASWLMCPADYARYRIKVEGQLSLAWVAVCPACPRGYQTVSFDTIFRVVPL